MIRPVDFIESGLSGIHPRELSMYTCLCKGYLASALTCLDNGENFILPTSITMMTKQKNHNKKYRLVETTRHVMKDSIVGVLSDIPPCRAMN